MRPATSTEIEEGEARPGQPQPRSAEGERHSDLVPRLEALLIEEQVVDPGKMSFKLGKGLIVTSANERFALAIRLRAQFLYTLLHDQALQELEQGFQIRRARLQFEGHVVNKHNKFKAEFALSPRDMGINGDFRYTPILDWYGEFDYLRDLTVRVGQYKVPFSRQRVISSGDLQMVDRALASSEFNLDRDIGVDLRSKDLFGLGRLRYYAGAYLGEGRDQYDLGGFDMMYIGRVEVLPFGLFVDYKEADFERTRQPRLSLGAAYAFVDDAKRNRGILGSVPSDGGTTDYHNVTADFVFKYAGLSLTGEFFYRKGARDYGEATILDEAEMEVPAPLEEPRNGLGWFAQGGYLVPRIPFEIVARYSQVRGLGVHTSLSDRHEVGGGFNYYVGQHPLKLQLDYFHLWEEGMFASGIDQVRLQLQLAF